MAEAIWIINLATDEKYHTAFNELISNYEASGGFQIGNLRYNRYSEFNLNSVSIETEIGSFITDVIQRLPTQWPHFSTLRVNDTLRIYLVGDLMDQKTLELFHLLPTEIRRYQLTHAAVSLQVKVTGLLSFNYDISQNVKDEQVLFLTQLNLLQNNNFTAIKPYKEIFFFQKPATDPDDHFMRISQFVLFSALDGTYHTDDYSFNEAGCAGIYFEREVQVHNEAATLAAILLNSFNFSDSATFIDPNEASILVSNSNFVRNEYFDYTSIAKKLKINQVNPFLTIENVKPKWWKFLSIDILTNYYYGYIPRVIHKLVNETGRGMESAYEKFLLKLQQNKRELLNGSNLGQGLKTDLSNLAFKLFSTPELKCSLEQQRYVIMELQRLLKAKFEEFNVAGDTDELVFEAFAVPPELKPAYQQARNNLVNEEQSLKDLESNLKNHPVFSAKWIRALILACLSLVLLFPLFTWIVEHRIIDLGPISIIKPLILVICFAVPLVFAFIQTNWLLNRIRLYQKQYLACLYARINNKAKEEIQKAIAETYNHLKAYCEFLERKRQQIAKNLRQLSFQENKFIKNNLFQPLWESTALNLDDRNLRVILGQSGKFGEEPVLGSFSGYMYRDSNNQTVDFVNLIQDDPKIMDLIRELMTQPAQSVIGNYKDFVKTSSINAILLLDISVSMNENMPDNESKINHLRKAVKEIEADISWVAFSDEIYNENGKTVFSKNDPIPDPVGGTELYKGFIHLCDNRNLGFEKVILVSDGLPFGPEAALNRAQELGLPVDVIYIGSDTRGENFMRQLADETGGKMVVAREVDLKDKLKSAFTIDIQGRADRILFWELMRDGNYSACAEVAQEFATRKLITASTSTSVLLNNYFRLEGITQWVKSANPTCSLRPGIATQPVRSYYIGLNALMAPRLLTLINGTYVHSNNDVIVEILKHRKLEGISQLLISMDATKESDVFIANRESETSKLCNKYLAGNPVVSIFSNNHLSFSDNPKTQ